MKLLLRKMEFILRSDRGQSAVEFLILVGAVLFFFISFLIVVQTTLTEKKFEGNNLAVREVAYTVQDEVNLASSAGDGYRREFELPDNINGLEYEIEIVEELVYVRTLNDRHAISLPIPSVTGNVVIGSNVIEKQNEEILINS